MARIVDPEEREMDVLRRLVELRGKDVLDIGCGRGRTARRIARTAASVLGVDPDDESIAEARANSPGDADGCTFRAADAVMLELPPAGFDVVLFSRSL